MRSSSTSGHELEKFIHVITDHIDVVIFESKGTFNQHGQRDLAEEALDLLSSLSDTKNVLDSLGKKIANDSSNKSVKQKIANTSYEIAKYAKDLLSLLE
jgi:F420-0:gamma-glutamyl ligase